MDLKISLSAKVKKFIIIFIYFYALVVDLANSNMLTVALPTISKELDIPPYEANWIIITYMFSLTFSILLTKYILNKLGDKRTFILSLSLFLLGGILCIMSHHFYEIALSRIVQGLGGGLLIPVGQIIVFREFVGSARAKVSSLIQIAATVSPAISPYVGGYLSDSFGWRYIFYVITILILPLFPLLFFLENFKDTKNVSFDCKGFILIFIFILSVLLFLNTINDKENPFFVCLNIGTIILSFLFIILLVKNKKVKIIDFNVFQEFSFSKSIALFSIYGLSFTAYFIINSFFIQDGLGLSGKTYGVSCLYYVSGQVISNLFIPRLLKKFSYQTLVVTGCSAFLGAILTYFFVKSGAHISFIYSANLIAGMGAGLIGPVLLLKAFSAYSDKMIESASIVWNLNRQFIYAVGTTFASALLSYGTFFSSNEIKKYYLCYAFLATLFCMNIIFTFVWKRRKIRSSLYISST